MIFWQTFPNMSIISWGPRDLGGAVTVPPNGHRMQQDYSSLRKVASPIGIAREGAMGAGVANIRGLGCGYNSIYSTRGAGSICTWRWINHSCN